MADNGNVRLAAADLLLDRGMRFIITDAPVLLRLLRLNRIRIRRLKGGTILEFSRVILKGGLESIETAADANGKMESIAEVIAIAVLNSRVRIWLLKGLLTKFLLWKADAVTLVKIYLIISSINKVSDFTTITGYFVHQTQAMMNPRIPGQTGTGS